MSERNRLVARLRALRAAGQKGIAPFLTAGDGGLDVTLAVLRALDRARVPCVELGLPFSDPIADGPVLQEAAQRSLGSGTTFEDVMDMVTRFRRGTGGALGSEMPIVVMSYANPLVKRGWGNATRQLARAGVDALLVADLPIEEGAPMASAARLAGLAPIFFVAPTTSDERVLAAAQQSHGFLYAIGRLGVTGGTNGVDPETQAFLARVRSIARDLPVAAGFGIATASEVERVLEHADLAIVGSAFVEHLHAATRRTPAHRRPEAAAQAAREFLQILASGLPGGSTA